MPAEMITFEGPAGRLEGMTFFLEDPKALAIICHPHSLFGGTMKNKVVSTLARMFFRLQVATLCFNFRGVEESEGEFSGGIGELEDLKAAAQYLRGCFPHVPLYLAGFSFGSYVTALGADLLKADMLISIAPPVTHFDFTKVPVLSCPWWVVQGDKDEVIEAFAVEHWARTRTDIRELLVFEEAGHYFHGRLVELADRLSVTISPHIGR